MTEEDIYKVASMRCPACEYSFESEIECLQPVKAGDSVLDSCPHCGFLGDIKIIAFLLLFACVFSWAACHDVGVRVGVCSDAPTTNDACGSYGSSYPYCVNTGISCNNTAMCGGSGIPIWCATYKYCTTQAELDSVVCVNGGNTWQSGQCQAPCDSTKWTCHTYTEHSQTTIASDNVTCFNGDCFGGIYCEYIASTTTECDNECGGHTEQSTQVPIRYDGRCNEDNLNEEECTGVRCISLADGYSLFKLCKSREIVNGEQKFLPHFVGGGKGTCKAAGYKEADENDLSGGGSDSTSVSEDCFLFGLGCPSPKDTTDYSNPDNRTPDKCTCENFDGFKGISRIVCPDGSITVFYGSCDDFRSSSSVASSSSENPPESSSSGSENPPTSSGGTLQGNWTTYSQGEDIKTALGLIASKLDNKQNINNVNSVNLSLDEYSANVSDSAPAFVVPDSMFDPIAVIDTAGFVYGIFGRVTEENDLIDTLGHVSGVCPVCTFFSGGANIVGGKVKLPEIRIDFSNVFGYDFCAIVSRIVIALAAVVSFFIGFSIFKNISQ